MEMLLENLIPHGFQTQLHSPPHVLEERPLKELYMVLSERYHYDQFTLLGGGQGAVLKQGNNRACEIYREHIAIKEQPTSLAFEEFSDQVSSIAGEIREAVKIPIWIVQQNVLRCLVPFDEAVLPLLRKHIFSIPDSALEAFERPILGMCLRLEFPPLPNDPTQLQLRIEPYFRPNEDKMLYLELTSRFLQPTQENGELSNRLTVSYQFIREKACVFLEDSLARRE